jgi:hypothetical protein
MRIDWVTIGLGSRYHAVERGEPFCFCGLGGRMSAPHYSRGIVEERKCKACLLAWWKYLDRRDGKHDTQRRA